MLTKLDLAAPELRRQVIDALNAAFPGRPLFAISAVTGEGIDALLAALMRDIEENRLELQTDPDMVAAETAMQADIGADVLRQSLLRRPQRGVAQADAERDDDDDDDSADDDDDAVEVIYRSD